MGDLSMSVKDILLKLYFFRREFKRGNIDKEELDEELIGLINNLGELTLTHGDHPLLDSAKHRVWSAIEKLVGMDNVSESIYNKNSSVYKTENALSRND
jgi:hypothetical protein